MYRILTASKDTYITDKIIGNKFRATDANAGYGGTLDIFKLYGESIISGTDNAVELSRALIKFDLDPLRSLTGTILDTGHSSFRCVMRLTDIYGGQPTPTNFKLILFPLSRSFDEGIGVDVASFQDVGSANFFTSSMTTSAASIWYLSGANKQGYLGSSDIDIISSGTLSGTSANITLWKTQSFAEGDEDLAIDVTQIVSATIAGLIPDEGFRLSYSGTQESDQVTRFVKRFASRHVANTRIRPRIAVQYNDSLQDDHRNIFFDLTGTLFLNNQHRGQLSNLLSGSAASEISGDNCIILKLSSGSYTKYITGSQHKIGNQSITGMYSASFAISSFNSTLRNEIINAGSGTFEEIWESPDGSVGYHTGSLVIKSVARSTFANTPGRFLVNITNMRASYLFTEKVRFRVFVSDLNTPIPASKLPREEKSLIFRRMYYRVRDLHSNDAIIPFDYTTNSTLLSTDTDGMYFDLYMDAFDKGRVYTVDFLIKDMGSDLVYKELGAFRIDV